MIITQNKPLSYILQSNDKKIFVEMTVEELDKKMENAYMIINWKRISTARNLIREYGSANSLDYYIYFVLPSLPDHIKTRMEDLIARLPPDVIEKTSLETILRKQKEFE